MTQLRDSIILRKGLRMATAPLAVFSLYLLFAGHNQPGGGFAGGLVAGVAIALAWATDGEEGTRRIVQMRATQLIGIGLLVATATGFGGFVWADAYLESAVWDLTLPLFGEVKLVSAVFFDIGVYLVVVGVSAGLVRSLGAGSGEEPA